MCVLRCSGRKSEGRGCVTIVGKVGRVPNGVEVCQRKNFGGEIEGRRSQPRTAERR